tara:strand:- start:1254 stop:1937 length:684 start_codon:yes stop_codon:yes gene_type:complete
MKKYFLVLGIVTTILFSSCSTKNDCNTLWGFNGHVKTSLEKVYDAEEKFGNWENGDINYYGHSLTKFDKNGNYTEINQLDSDGKMTKKTIPIRENGRVIEEITYNKDGKKESLTKIIFINNNETESVSYDNKGNKESSGKIFRENGKNIKSTYTLEGGDKIITSWEYDKNGNDISLKTVNQKGEILYYEKYEYLKFDEKNNWTRKLIYKDSDNDNPKNIVIREIKYY